jgi:nucleotide-binding universal stress UspA family protein
LIEEPDVIEIHAIVAPTDFSAHSEKAVRYACGLAERLGSELHLVHVLSEILPAGPDPLMMPVMPPEYYKENEDRAKETLGRLLDPSWGSPRSVVTAVRWGGPVESIVSYAIENRSDLIVIATHGRTGLSHVLLGSVAERIVREAPCPVLTLRDRDRGPAVHHNSTQEAVKRVTDISEARPGESEKPKKDNPRAT